MPCETEWKEPLEEKIPERWVHKALGLSGPSLPPDSRVVKELLPETPKDLGLGHSDASSVNYQN